MTIPTKDAPPRAKPRPLTDPGAILGSIGQAVYDWDILTDAVRWSPNACGVLGLEPNAPIATGRNYHEQTAPVSVASRRDTIVGGGRDSGRGVPYHVRYALQTFRGGRCETVWVDDTGRWFGGRDGLPERAHGLVRVVAGRGVGEEATAAADFDPLTGCFSRPRTLGTLATMFERRARAHAEWGLLLIELDDLARLNRQHGYDAVDELIAGAATVLRTQIRSTDWLGRYAGNTFALVLDHCDPAQVAPAAARALDLLTRAPFATSAGPLRVRAHAGGVLAPRHGRTVRALLLNAEMARDAAKDTKGRFALHDPCTAACDEARRTDAMIDTIVGALNDGRVTIALQPIVAARSREIAMHEALVRIVTIDGAVLHPSAILPAAEKGGLLPLLDQRVFDLAIAQLRCRSGTISVNVSGATLADPDWPARVAAAVRLNPAAANRLIVEAGEPAAAADLARSTKALLAVRETGVRLAIDHFGVGHVSLRDLRRLSPDFLKIDGAFVQNIGCSADDRFVFRSLLGIAKHVGAAAVAEWVDSADTAAVLTDWGVSYLQGAHLGDAELLAEFLAETPAEPAMSKQAPRFSRAVAA